MLGKGFAYRCPIQSSAASIPHRTRALPGGPHSPPAAPPGIDHDCLHRSPATADREGVTSLRQARERLSGEAVPLDEEQVRQPLVMHARAVHGLLEVHPEIDQVGDYL